MSQPSVTILAALSPDQFHGIEGNIRVESAPGQRGATHIALGASKVRVVTGGRLRWVREAIADVLSQLGKP